MEQLKKGVNAIQKKITERKKASKGQDKCEDLLAEKEIAEQNVVKGQEKAEELKVYFTSNRTFFLLFLLALYEIV